MSEPRDETDKATAIEVLRGAFDAAYRFPVAFPGFAADITFAREGLTAAGTVVVRSPRAIALDIALDRPDLDWLRQELASMVGHLWPLSFEASVGRYQPVLEPEDGNPLGRLLRLVNDPAQTTYRILNGQIAQVSRVMGDRRAAITTQAHLTTGNGTILPTEYVVTSWEVASGRLTRADICCDRYLVVASAYLPSARRVVTADDAGLAARRFALARHHLLTPEAAAAG